MTIGTIVTTDSGRFAGRTGTIVDICPDPAEVWVRWQEGSFKTLDLALITTLRPQ